MSNIDQLACSIYEHGTRHVFGITGSGLILTLLDSLEKQQIEPIRTYFEGSAAIMAGTVGRLSGKSGVAYGIKGPGLANMVPGMAACHLDASPMVAIVEAYPPGSGAYKAHKRLNHQLLSGAVCKTIRGLSNGILDFNDLASLAEAEVPGPVVLELTGSTINCQKDLAHIDKQNNNDAEILRLIEKSQRPAIIAGSWAIRQGWQSELEQLRIPVFSTAASKGIVNEHNDHAAGIYTGVGLELTPEYKILPMADLIIGIGLRPNEVLATKAFHCTSINIETSIIPGSEAFCFQATTATILPQHWAILIEKSWGLDDLKTCLHELDRIMLQGFLPGRVFRTIEGALSRKIRVVMDTGYFCTIGEHAWKASSSDLCLLSGQGRYMGTSIPMAIGAAIHDPSTPVVAIAGDGGIGMYVSEIRIAIDRQLPILFVLMSDGCFGSISTRAIKDGLTRTPIDVANPSWIKIMEGFGLRSWEINTPESLQDALNEWNKSYSPGYLEIRFSQKPYEQMCKGIR